MNLFENISLAVAGLISNKMRALLTMLGIIPHNQMLHNFW